MDKQRPSLWKRLIIYILVFVLCLEGALMKSEPMKAEAATTYKFTMSYITGGGDLTSKFKITIGGKKLTGLCRHGGAKSSHGGKATAKLLSRTDNRFYLAYYYGYVKKWNSGSKGCDLARAFNYATYKTAYHQTAKRSKEMISKAKAYCKEHGVPDNFVAYNCDPTNGTQEFIAWYYAANGSLKLVKKSSDTKAIKTGSYTFKDIKYRVYEKKSTSSTVVGTLTLNASGTSNTLKLAPNGMKAKTYYVKEYSTNNYYDLNSTWYTVSIKSGDTTTLNTKDTPKYGTLTFTKTMSADSAEDSSVQGFKFTLTNTNDSSLKYTATSDANGKVSFTKIPIGKYKLTETITSTQAANNYVNITGSKTLTIKAGSNTLGTNNTFVNERIVTKPRLIVQKFTDDGGPVEGWKFTVTNTKTNESVELVTDGNGVAKIDEIETDVLYAVKENMTEEQQVRYIQPISQTGSLPEGSEENLVFNFENKAIKQPVSLKKTADDGNIQGIEFTLTGTQYAGTSDVNKMDPIVATTDERGLLDFGDLVPGEYVIEETGFDPDVYANNHKLDGYDNPAMAFTVNAEGVFMNGSLVPNGEFEFINDSYSIELVKTEILVDGTKTDNPVKDAEYELYYIEADGSETLIDSYVTDENGKFTVTGVKKGNYKLYETAVPMGYVEEFEIKNEGTEDETQSPIPIEFTVNQKITVVEDTNQQKYGTIFIVKEDKDRYAVEDAEFTLFTDKECTTIAKDKDGNELVAKTDEKGYIIFENLKWMTYYLKETKAPRGYVQSEEVHEFVLGYDASEEMIIVDREIWLTNDHKLGSVELLKVDEEDKVISGAATYDLYTTDGTLVAADLVTGHDNNGDGTDDGTGLIRVDNLEWGSYYFLEKIAPDGYGLSNEKIRFTVNAMSVSAVQRVKAEDRTETTYVIATKKIKAKPLNFGNGTPTFFFNLKGTTASGNKKEYNQSVTFSKEFVENHTDADGYVSLSVTFSDLAVGNYVLSEHIVSRFDFEAIEEDSIINGTIKGETVEFNLPNAQTYGAATFINKNFETGDFSDSSTVANIVKKQKTYTALVAEYNGEVLEGNAPIENFNDYLTVYAIYDDGTERILEPDEYKAYDIDGNELKKAPKVAGWYTITVEHEEKGITHADTVEVQVSQGKKVTVKFVTNGGSALEDMSVWKYDTLAESTVDGGKYTTLREGYNFEGWFSDTALTQEVEPDTTPILGDTTLYAKWSPIVYTITYDLKEGTLDNSIDTFTAETETFTLPIPVREGYSFDGWTGSNGDVPQTEVIIPQGSFDNREYEAHWTVNKVIVHYNTNGGRIGYGKTTTYSEDSNETILKADGSKYTHTWTYNVADAYGFVNNTTFGAEKPGYIFTGWSTSPDGSTTVYDHDDKTVVPTDFAPSVLTERESTVVMYAQYKAASNTLITGAKFNQTIKSGVTKTVFTDALSPTNVAVTDLSSAGDKGIVGWVQSGTYYISSQRSGVKVKANKDSKFMFNGNPDHSSNEGKKLWQNVTSHDLTNLDTSNVTSFYGFFHTNKALTTITGINNLNTAKATNINAMFSYCSSLKTLNISGFNTSKVTTMQSVVTGCTSLTSINVSGWDVNQVTNFSHFFDNTPKLTTIDLSTWTTTAATTMNYMFAAYSVNEDSTNDYTNTLSTLKLGSGWTTKNVKTMNYMFYGCVKLTYNCSKWNVDKVTSHTGFNKDAPNVKAPSWP